MHKFSQLIEFFVMPTMSRQRWRAVWQPAVDVYRCQHGWLLKFDLAGINPNDVQLQVHDCKLSVSGSRRDWQIDEGQETHRLEIAYSHFERTVELPEAIDQAKVVTEYRDGMFLVHLDTTQKPEPGM